MAKSEAALNTSRRKFTSIPIPTIKKKNRNNSKLTWNEINSTKREVPIINNYIKSLVFECEENFDYSFNYHPKKKSVYIFKSAPITSIFHTSLIRAFCIYV